MHLLYLDDSGAAGNANEQYLVLGGVSVFEAQSHYITQELDRLAENINPGDPHGVEFHASETFARRSQPWSGLSQEDARGTIKSVLDVLANAYDSARAFDKSTYETTLQQMSVEFRTLGTSWGVIRNLADTPLFVDSRASRVIQLADHVAYAVFRRYQSGDTQYFDRIARKFDSEDGIIHGLAHKELGNPHCMCIACLSRRAGEGRQPGD